jgi:hypothetical protein
MATRHANKCLFRGNLSGAPEQTTYGKTVKTSVGIATHEINGRGEKITTWVNPEWWNGAGDAIMALDLKKGDFVQLEDTAFYSTKKEGRDGKPIFYHGHRGGTLSLYVDPDDIEEDADELPLDK